MAQMDEDLLHWAEGDSPGVGGNRGGDLTELAEVAPPDPSQYKRKIRSRPNKGRMKRSDRLKPILPEPPWDILRETGYPIPPDVQILGGEMPRYWRQGPRADRWRREVFAMWGHTCHLCKHGEAKTADHLVPLSVWANQPYDARLSRPAHGVEGCPTCGVPCNSSRGNKAIAREIGNYQPPVAL